MRGASSDDGGFGWGAVCFGFFASAAGLLAIHSQRVAAASAPLMMKWIFRTDAADGGLQR